MIIFHNPGIMPLEAIRLMGASVKQPGAFGRFGTGLKYAIATILRGGGNVTIWRGDQPLRFELHTVEMSGVEFHEVVLLNVGAELVRDTRTRLGFTTQLGKDWEPWMALRELACNARDEGGGYRLTQQPVPSCFRNKSDETLIIVDWSAMDAELEGGEHSVFAPEVAPLVEERGVRVLPGPSPYLYHRGVRVWKLPRPSVFTYDIEREVDLTEDRTVKYAFCVVADVRNMLLATAERGVIAGALTAGKDHWEGAFDWSGKDWHPTEPGLPWLEEAAALRAAAGTMSKSAVDLLLAHQAIQTQTHYGSGSWEEPTGVVGNAFSQLEDMGVDLTKVNVFLADDLGQDRLSTLKGGAVLVSRQLEQARSPRLVAHELLSRWLEAQSGGDHDRLLKLVVPLLLDQCYDFKREREVWEAREAGHYPTMLESWLGIHSPAPKPDIPADAPDF